MPNPSPKRPPTCSKRTKNVENFLEVARERMDPEVFRTDLETAKRRALKASREP